MIKISLLVQRVAANFFLFQNVLGMKSEMCVNKAVSFMCSPHVIHLSKPLCGSVPCHGPTAIWSPADWCICSVLVPSMNNHVSAIKQFCYLQILMEFSCNVLTLAEKKIRLLHLWPNSEDEHPPGVSNIASSCVVAEVRPRAVVRGEVWKFQPLPKSFPGSA